MDVLQGGYRAGDDVDAGVEAYAAHADGFAHAWLVVDDVLLHHGVQDAVVGRDVDGFGGFDGAVDVCLGNFAVFDFHHTLRVEAADVVAGDTGGNAADFAVGHQLGFADRLLDGLRGGVDVGYHARFQAARGGLADADDVDAVVFLHFTDQGDNFGGADVEGTDIVFSNHDVPVLNF